MTNEKETFMKEKMTMGYSWFEALAQWNRKNEKQTKERDLLESYLNQLDEYHN